MKHIPLSLRARYNLIFILQHFLPRSARLESAKNETRRKIAACVESQGPARRLPVERVKSLSPEDFRRRHLRPGYPVIIEKGAASWPLASRWSFGEFRRRFGSETIKLVQREGLTDDDFVFEREYSEEIRFDNFLDEVQRGGRKYMRFSPLLEKFPELLEDFDHEFFKVMTASRWGQIYQMFIGGAGTMTPLHNAMSPFFFVNICGVKRWLLVPNQFMAILDPATDGVGYNHSDAKLEAPDPERYPGLASVDGFEAVLEPGDILYVPSWMWHRVQNDAATIGVRCGFVSVRNIVGESLTLAFTRVFGARNPTMLEALYHMLLRKNLPERASRLLNPSLIRR